MSEVRFFKRTIGTNDKDASVAQKLKMNYNLTIHRSIRYLISAVMHLPIYHLPLVTYGYATRRS